MPCRIEDYAIVGNCETVALVGRDGSIDWLGLPRFDSPACFAALLGEPKHGRWLIAPADGSATATRSYRGDTLILETVFRTGRGAVRVTDFMVRRDGAADLMRIVTGLEGEVAMRMELVVRFDYGSIVPWVSRQEDGRLQFTAGPDRLVLDAAIATRGEDRRTVADFSIRSGQETSFSLTWAPSWRPPPQAAAPPPEALRGVEAEWTGWAGTFSGRFAGRDAVLRSLLTLKSLAHWETGGIVAAATTSLPERIGGERNWDYRFCWLRDATFTLLALIGAGYLDEAKAWHEWLLRAVAGSPDDVQTMYGVAGERRLDEYVVPWLPGYSGSGPVRIGNAAVGQLQLDVYGEVLDTFYVARRAGLATSQSTWDLECALLAHLEAIWREPDEGIWEVRGERRHFTHSKVMAWVAFDRAVRSVEAFGLQGPVERWREARDAIHASVCEHGFDSAQNAFVQSYGASALDASCLLIPLVGFLPPDDPRVRGTIAAIERQLMREGLVLRYDTGSGADGLPAGEGAFLACSFWLADTYALAGRLDDAHALFDRLLALRNDVGLLAEEYDPHEKRQLGNFPQAFSHLALINTAHNLANADGPAKTRADRSATAG
ncbi:GH15 family glucan-1,4-alpha-glucosidase [Roseiarcus fermentans]|uniref:Trehalase n=1 Tax=Roseiarcus fermentans TaxID=1473586 RepID=A0A366EK98_9HYPH|nr:glycoside hydrolase family 15 protein [Roseiarcus fermentans]RBP02821.1 GH15 family glucan-1,4-alpha-glucosidase [Roseiarcus fermentans]